MSTRDDRIAIALRLSNALRRTAIDDTNETPPVPPGYCGRGPDEACGMIDREECRTHYTPPDNGPALLSIAGTRAQAREELKARRRAASRF
jgi:hypothetical protein